MILRFRHKGLQRLFERGDTSGVSTQQAKRIARILAILNVAEDVGEMALPGFRLHQLKGDRRGQWAVAVSGNMRIVFVFDDGDATDVDLIDYH